METDNIRARFNISPETYDAQRKYFIPCFDDYYETGIMLLSQIRENFDSILDLGAGTGLLSKYLYEKYPVAKYTLVDIAEQILDVAKIRFKGLNNFRYVLADYSTALPDGKYDLISSALSIHHLTEDEKFTLYSNIYKKLPLGGCLLNLDQFNAGSEEMNNAIDKLWCSQIQQTNISEKERNLWMERRKLDKENTIPETLSILEKAGFSQVECVYRYFKFGVVVAIK